MLRGTNRDASPERDASPQRRIAMKKKVYIQPLTRLIQVQLEEGLCAASKESVVIDNDNTTVDISRQEVGGDFEVDMIN